jgi:hypothetical protein
MLIDDTAEVYFFIFIVYTLSGLKRELYMVLISESLAVIWY